MKPATAKRILQRQLAALRSRLGADGGPVRMNGRGDEGDQAVQRREVLASAATREQLLLRVKAIDRALARIAEGTYGRCVACEGPIAAKRLEIMPECERCIRCQEAAERAARDGGHPQDWSDEA